MVGTSHPERGEDELVRDDLLKGGGVMSL